MPLKSDGSKKLMHGLRLVLILQLVKRSIFY
ncbi:MAG: hypothetical protein RIT36_1292 [Bacteroidota bacterium]